MQVRAALLERVRADVPFLGICLGLHALFQSSEEAPASAVSGFLTAKSGAFRWRQGSTYGLERSYAAARTRLLRHLSPHPYLYFAHSFYAPLNDATAATCDYMLRYTAALECNNIYECSSIPRNRRPRLANCA